MLDDLQVTQLLCGYRGAPAHDSDALVSAIEAMAHLGTVLGDHLSEAEINPLFVLPAGQGVAAVTGWWCWASEAVR